MQQLAPNPLGFGEGDPQTVQAYLRNWLQHYQYANEPHRPLATTPQGSLLKLDALGWDKLLADTADFYGLQLPAADLAGLATIQDMEAYVHRQFLELAA